MTSALTLIGLGSLLAGGVVEGALRYANTIHYRWTASLFVVPGLYTVSSKLLKRCNNRFALVFSPGERDSRKKILGFECTSTYKYFGVCSGTRAPVLNPLFESWMNIENIKSSDAISSAMLRDRPNMGSRCVLGATACVPKEENSLIGMCDPVCLGAAIVLQFCSIVIFVYMIKEKDTAGIVINAINMLSYFLINLVVTRDQFSVPKPQPAKDVPKGNAIITDKANNKLWVVISDENVIQSIAQKEIEVKVKCNEYVETFVYVVGTLTAVATILVVPAMSKRSQIYIAAQFGIGLFASIIFSAKDGDIMLKKLFEMHYEADPVFKKFTNRATAVAFAVLHAEASVDYVPAEVLPITEDYNTYRKVLQEIIEWNPMLQRVRNDLANNLYSVYTDGELELELVKNIAKAVPAAAKLSHGKIPTNESINSWPGRLLADITEAFVEKYK